jgi:hypothetical protein
MRWNLNTHQARIKAKNSTVSKPYQRRGNDPKTGQSAIEEKPYLLLVQKSAFTAPDYDSMINNEAAVWPGVT